MVTESAVWEAINSAPINSRERFRLKSVMRNPFRKAAKARLMEEANQHLLAAQAITISGEGEDQVVEAAIGWAAIVALIIEFLPVLLDLLSRFGG